MQPRPGTVPVPRYGVRRDLQNLGNLFHAEPAKEPQFNHAAAALVQLAEFGERIVQFNQFDGALCGNRESFIERQRLASSSAPLRSPGPRHVDQNPSHELSGNSEKLRAILPSHVLLPEKPKVGFMDQSGGLERMACGFTPHIVTRHAPQFGVDQRREPVERGAVTFAPSNEKFSDVLRLRIHQGSEATSLDFLRFRLGTRRSEQVAGIQATVSADHYPQ